MHINYFEWCLLLAIFGMLLVSPYISLTFSAFKRTMFQHTMLYLWHGCLYIFSYSVRMSKDYGVQVKRQSSLSLYYRDPQIMAVQFRQTVGQSMKSGTDDVMCSLSS